MALDLSSPHKLHRTSLGLLLKGNREYPIETVCVYGVQRTLLV